MHKYRSFILPIAILIGILFYKHIAMLKCILPFLLFFMIFFNFTSLNFKKLKISKMDIILVAFQIVVSAVSYLLLSPLNEILAEGVLIGVICPVAASVVVVACMLGANRETITSFTLIDNIVVAVAAPAYFTLVGHNPEMSFVQSFGMILYRIAPVLVLPLIIAALLQRFMPSFNAKLIKIQGVSFYLWAIALTITIGQTIDFIYLQGEGNEVIMILLAAISLLFCFIQFSFGRCVGAKFGDKTAGGQALGQKNTAMAIWMATTYLNPLTSIFPASYSIWQNLYNSYQLYRHDKNGAK